jgi:WD40 repeat protein
MHYLGWLLSVTLMTVSVERAAALPDERPTPRVEVGAHTGSINKLSVDHDGKLLLTVSDDKTARLWDARTGRLLHVLRVPIENGHEGQLYAGALTPNGRIAAVAGYTGSYMGKSIVYFFDTVSGRRLSEQSTSADSSVENLAFSNDGKVLAVCLSAGRGVRIFDLEKRALVRSEEHTHDKILGAAFSSSGDFAITTLDGYLWVFRKAANYEPTSVRLVGGARPMHVQFAPDGAELAVGFDGDPAVSIIDAKSLKETLTAKLPPNAGQHGLHVVEWSNDGQYLYAGGETLDGIEAPLYRIAQHGRGTPEKVLTATRRITDVRRLPDGAMAFTSAQPEVGVLEMSGRTRWRLRSPTLDLRRLTSEFILSFSGNAVTFGSAQSGLAFAFDVLQPVDSALRQASTMGPTAPAADPPGWKITLSDEDEHVSINGADVALESRERVRSWAVTRDAAGVILGTSWSLRRCDRAGRLVWTTPLSSNVTLVRVTDDGRNIVTALSDGSVRWYRAEDGKEFLALFVNRNGQDWIAWIPSGYYMSSTAGDNFIGWHVNRGDRDPDFYRAVQFERILYRPDLVQSYFRNRGLTGNARDVVALETMLPPHIEIVVAPQATDAQLTKVRVSGRSDNLPMQDWSLFVNGIPAIAGQNLASSERLAFSKDVEIRLSPGLDRLQVESRVASSQGSSLGIAEQYVDIPPGAAAVEQGKLFLLAVGVSKFNDAAIHGLPYAANDASEVARTFGELLGKTGLAIESKQLIDAEATQANVASALHSFLASARAEDTVIVFLASHGVSDSLGNYFFVPSDGRMAEIKRLETEPNQAPSLLRWDTFVDQLRRTAGRRLLIVDTCSSGGIGGNFDAHSLAKRSMSSNFALMAAAGTHEESQELASAQHGLFTYGLLQALKTGYDPNHDGVVSLTEAFQFAFNTVQDMRNKAVGQQTPQLTTPDVLANMALAPGAQPGKSAQIPVMIHSEDTVSRHAMETRLQIASRRSLSGH